MIIKQLNGHSGCKVLLYEEKNKKFVRKISKSIDYNDRLIAQCEKQKTFKSSFIRTPCVFDEGIKDDLYFFDMQYINGITFNGFISTNPIQNINPIIDKLFKFIYDNTGDKKDYTEKIFNKLTSLENLNMTNLKRYKKYCLNHDWSQIPSGFCHGDLTFENIIIYNSEVYLIDFLDCFMETKYSDFSKILQDVLLLWSWRNSPNKPFVKNIYLYNRIVSLLDKEEISIVHRLLVLNMLRILPYSNKQTSKMVQTKLDYIMGRIDQ